MNQLSLALRFILEIVMIIVIVIWNQGEGILKFIMAIGIPVLIAAIWGIFTVSGDPSRSGKTVVRTPGMIRLILELVFFGYASWALYDLDYKKLSLILIIFVIIHYILSFERIKWIYRQK